MQQAIDFIQNRTGNFQPEIGIILGSGLGDFANGFSSVSIPQSYIPDIRKDFRISRRR